MSDKCTLAVMYTGIAHIVYDCAYNKPLLQTSDILNLNQYLVKKGKIYNYKV